VAVSELSAVEPALDAVVGGEDAGSIDVPSLVTSLGRATLGSRRLARAGLGLSVEAARVAVGGSRVEPARRDFRFDDPTWTENPGYRRVKQLYLAWSKVVRSPNAAGPTWNGAPGSGPGSRRGS
jgi:polyhydroxyalkanoate synthase